MHRPGNLCVSLLAVLLLGGFLGTPLQILQSAGARIVPLERETPAPVRVHLRGWRFNDLHLSAASALCSNHRQRFSELRELDLTRSRITESALASSLVANSSHYPNLRVLNLTGCNVSSDTIAMIRRAHPECRIIR